MKKMIPSKQTILVIGGRGFIGRHIVSQLKLLGANVVIGTRNIKHTRLTTDPIRQVALHEIKHADDWIERLNGIDVVVNAVGILRQRFGETYDQVHHHSLVTLANVCEEKQIRLVHISALGIDNHNKSRFSISKRLGERVLKNSNANWAIVRPSLVDGSGGFGAKWFRHVAKWPIYFIPANAQGFFAPVDADDLGEAIAKIALKRNHLGDRIYELGGTKKMNFQEYLKLLRPKHMQLKPVVVRVPATIARAVSHLFDLFHFSPYSFGHYELLKYDNVPKVNRLEEVLCRRAKVITCDDKSSELLTSLAMSK